MTIDYTNFFSFQGPQKFTQIWILGLKTSGNPGRNVLYNAIHRLCERAFIGRTCALHCLMWLVMIKRVLSKLNIFSPRVCHDCHFRFF
jgi:hypothetical protein